MWLLLLLTMSSAVYRPTVVAVKPVAGGTQVIKLLMIVVVAVSVLMKMVFVRYRDFFVVVVVAVAAAVLVIVVLVLDRKNMVMYQ